MPRELFATEVEARAYFKTLEDSGATSMIVMFPIGDKYAVDYQEKEPAATPVAT
jgi:hypothetical protein